MAYSLVQSTPGVLNQTSQTSLTVTFGSATTPGDLIIFAQSCSFTNLGTVSATDNGSGGGNAYVLPAAGTVTLNPSGPPPGCIVGYSITTKACTTVTCSWSAGSVDQGLVAFQYRTTTGPWKAKGAVSATSPAPTASANPNSGNLALSSANNFLWGLTVGDIFNTTPTGSWAARFNQNGAHYNQNVFDILTAQPSGTYSLATTSPSQDWIAVMLAFSSGSSASDALFYGNDA